MLIALALASFVALEIAAVRVGADSRVDLRSPDHRGPSRWV